MLRFVCIFAILSTSAVAATDTDKLMKLLDEEEKAILAVPTHKRWPALYWKAMSINMEKFKIVRDKENKALLKASPDQISAKGRDYYFRGSLVYYKKIKKLGNFLVKRWPSFEYNDEIYYNLAAITIERNNQKEIERQVARYLKRALRATKKGSKIYKRAVVKLADHYYNLKNYKQSSRYYFIAIKFDKKSKWYTRHLFNLGWSLMSLNKTKQARKYIRDSLALSLKSKKNGRYVDYSDNVLDSLPVFIDEKDLKSSIGFFEDNLPAVEQDSLIQLATNAQGFGKYKMADYFYDKALKTALEKEGWIGGFEVVKKMLDYYLEVRRDKRIINFTRKLAVQDRKEKIFNKKQRQVLGERIKRHIRVVQDKSQAKEIGKVLYHFDTLKILEPAKKVTYVFYQAEALFAHKQYLKALRYYRRALHGMNRSKKFDIQPGARKIFDGMIASLNKVNINEKKKNQWNAYIYRNHIRIFPVDERSRKMYSKLYNIYLNQKKYAQCKKVLVSYAKSYPHLKDGKVVNQEDIKKQQFMISQIIDYYLEKKRYVQVAREIKWLKQERFAFDKKYIAKVSKVFGYKFFAFVKSIKDVKKRNQQYEKIYNDKTFPLFVRSDAAWYVGDSLLKSKMPTKSARWFQNSLGLLDAKNSLKIRKNVLSVIVKMVHLQDFDSSEKLASSYFAKQCNKKYELKEDFFNAMVLYSLVEGRRYKYIMGVINQGEKCGMGKKVLFESYKTAADFFRDGERYNDLLKLYREKGNQGKGVKYFRDIFLDMYWEFFIAGNNRGLKKSLGWLKDEKISKSKNVKVAIDFYELVQNINKQDLYSFELYDPDEKFDEDLFNKTMEENIVNLNKFKVELEKFMASGHPQVVVYGNHILSKRFFSLGKAILAVKPSGVDENYQKTFMQAMKQLGDQLFQEGKKKKREMLRIIKRTGIIAGIHRKEIEEASFKLAWGGR